MRYYELSRVFEREPRALEINTKSRRSADGAIGSLEPFNVQISRLLEEANVEKPEQTRVRVPSLERRRLSFSRDPTYLEEITLASLNFTALLYATRSISSYESKLASRS